MWGAPLVRNEFAKGFCTGVLGRTPPTSKLWHMGRDIIFFLIFVKEFF
jgi:hypothetical protein